MPSFPHHHLGCHLVLHHLQRHHHLDDILQHLQTLQPYRPRLHQIPQGSDLAQARGQLGTPFLDDFLWKTWKLSPNSYWTRMLKGLMTRS